MSSEPTGLPAGARVLFDEESIRKRIADLAGMLAREHLAGLDDVVLVPVLDGGQPLADAIRVQLARACPGLAITEVPLRVTRTDGTALAEPVVTGDDALAGVAGRLVLLVDDLVDEGATLALARDCLEQAGAARIITFVLLEKRRCEETGMIVDFCGFSLEYDKDTADRRWVFGFGMDLDGQWRELGCIAEIEVEM